MKEQRCHEEENGQKDTAGRPIKVRVCYCGTTTCNYLGSNSYELPKDFEKLKNLPNFNNLIIP